MIRFTFSLVRYTRISKPHHRNIQNNSEQERASQVLPSLWLLLIPSDRSYRTILTARALGGRSRDVGYGLGRDPRAILSARSGESHANPRVYSSPYPPFRISGSRGRTSGPTASRTSRHRRDIASAHDDATANEACFGTDPRYLSVRTLGRVLGSEPHASSRIQKVARTLKRRAHQRTISGNEPRTREDRPREQPGG